MDRFVVFKFQGEWLVTYADRKQSAFATRWDAERSAFDAADLLASSGHAVSVLIIPDEADQAPEGTRPTLRNGRAPSLDCDPNTCPLPAPAIGFG